MVGRDRGWSCPIESWRCSLVWRIKKQKDGFLVVDKSDGYAIGPFQSANFALMVAREQDGGVDVKNLNGMLQHGLSRRLYDEMFGIIGC